MSAGLGLSIPIYFIFSSSPKGKPDLFALNSPSSNIIRGHSVREVQVTRMQDKQLPIPIKLQSSCSKMRLNSPKSVKSSYTTPIISPRSFISTRTNACSPKLITAERSDLSNITEKYHQFQSPKQNINELVKNSLKNQVKTLKETQKKIENENKMKLNKKVQMKVFNKVVCDDNLLKFKQKRSILKAVWGKDDKKVINETKALRDLEKHKKPKEKKNTISFETFSNKKKPKKNYKKQNGSESKRPTYIEQADQNLSKQKAEIYQQLAELDNRVNTLKNLAVNSLKETPADLRAKAAIKIQSWYRGHLSKKSLEKQVKRSSIHNAINEHEDEDAEVQHIMGVKSSQDERVTPEHSKADSNKSYERLLASQMKMKIHQQQQLTELRAKDLQEMNKLAEVLGNKIEMKEKFQAMINRRYSKLVNLFEENIENIKQILSYGQLTESNLLGILSDNFNKDSSRSSSVSENKNIVDDIPLPSLRNTISEFSSSFLEQLKGVSNIPVDLTFEDRVDGKADYIDSPEELSVHSRETCTEPPVDSVSFPTFHQLQTSYKSQEEPNFPLISDSFHDNHIQYTQEKSELGALISMVGEIKDKKSIEESVTEESDNTLNLNEDKLKNTQVSPIFIYDESYSSNESGAPGDCSSIIASPVPESASESNSSAKVKPLRSFIEHFPQKEPSLFTGVLESSTEHEGYELIINRVLFTLEVHIFSIYYQEILSDPEFIFNIQPKSARRPRIPVKGIDSLLPESDQVDSSKDHIISFIKKLLLSKSHLEVVKKLYSIHEPANILSKIQENDDESDLDLQIFDINSLIQAEKANAVSESFDYSDLSPCIQAHNKMILEVLNEAIVLSSNNKFKMPWTFQATGSLDMKKIYKASKKKLATWSEVEAGKIPSADMMTCTGELEEDKLQAICEDKLSQFLILDVLEADEIWNNLEIERAQVLIDTSNSILSELYNELIAILN
jgi:IQ calmodulin-binding motif